MAIKLAYGFESGLIPANLISSSLTLTADTVIKRNGSYALKLAAGTAGFCTIPIPAMAATTDNTIVGFGYHADSIAAANGNVVSLNGGSATWVNLTYQTDGSLQVYTATSSGGTTNLLGTTASVLVNDTWHYIVYKVKFHDTTGIVEVWVDGIRVLNLVNVDTIVSGTLGLNRQLYFWKTAGSTATWYDDVVIADSTGSDVTDVFDPVKIEALNPTSDVAENWTPSTGTDSFAVVDERPVTATDYLTSTVSGTKDEWGMSDRTHTGPILALVAHAVGVNTDGGAAALKISLKRGGAESQSAALGLATSTTHVQHVVENDPTTGVAWTDANANAVTMTVEVA